MKDKRVENIVDYVLENAHQDFFDHLDDIPDLTEDEIETLRLWGNDDIGTTEEVKRLVLKLTYDPESVHHIFPSAVCLSYGWTKE